MIAQQLRPCGSPEVRWPSPAHDVVDVWEADVGVEPASDPGSVIALVKYEQRLCGRGAAWEACEQVEAAASACGAHVLGA